MATKTLHHHAFRPPQATEDSGGTRAAIVAEAPHPRGAPPLTTMAPYEIHGIDLPQDAIMPSPGGVDDADLVPAASMRPFPRPKTAERGRALQGWIHGHQAFFVSLDVATYAAKQVAQAARSGDLDTAETWMRRVAALRLGMAACMCAAGNMSRETYEGFIRIEMASFHPELSGLGSLDGWMFDEAAHEMTRALTELMSALPEAEANRPRILLTTYESANRKWWEYHAKLMHTLITVPVSLARMSASTDRPEKPLRYDELKARHRTPASLAIYDRFFACRRRPMSTLQFQRLARSAIERARPHQDPTPELRSFFARGERAMNEVLHEKTSHDRSSLRQAT